MIPQYREAMRNPLLVVIGVLALGFGLVFFSQGIGVITQIQSSMVNTVTWSVIGPLIALFGLGCIVAGVRPRSHADDDY